MLYKITDTDRDLAAQAADYSAGRQDSEWYAQQRAAGALPNDAWDARYFGALGEIAVAILLDREWGGFWKGEPDVLPNIEVRSSLIEGYGPIIKPSDLEDDRIDYMVGVHMHNDVSCFVLGWCHLTYGYAGAQECAQRRLGAHCKHYTNSGNVRIHPAHLRPINTLGAPK